MEQTEQRTMLSRWERAALAILFMMLILVSGVVVARLGASDGDVVGLSEARPSVASDVPRPVSLLDAYEVASEWAQVWDPDAWPILVSSQFEFPVEDGLAAPEATEGAYIFTFAAPEDDNGWRRLTLAVNRQSGVIYHESELASSVEPPESIEATLRSLPITTAQAFRIADEVIGQAYREECAAPRDQAQVILDSTDLDMPQWVVVFYDQRERYVNDIVVRIDANTGSTSTEQRDDISCDPPQ